MKNSKANILIGVGFIINSVVIIVDHFFVKVPHLIYLAALIIGIMFIFLGAAEVRKTNK